MNQSHHEQLTSQVLDILALYRAQLAPHVARSLGLLESYRALLIRYSSAPDRIRDTSLKMVWFLPDKTSIAGHNLSSFQHFLVCDSGFRGYQWDSDSSLGWIDKLVDLPVKWLHSRIDHKLNAQSSGFPSSVLAISPMSIFVENQSTKFDEFRFPSAADVGQFYGDILPRQSLSLEEWIQACGFVLHMVCDVCIPHHVLGWLLRGHQNFEDSLEDRWRKVSSHSQTISALTDFETVRSVIEKAAVETLAWARDPSNMVQVLTGKVGYKAAAEVCSRALEYCIKAIEVMCWARPQSFA